MKICPKNKRETKEEEKKKRQFPRGIEPLYSKIVGRDDAH